MVIQLGPELEAALTAAARQGGVSPEELAVGALRQHFLRPSSPITPKDEWERRLLGAATDCGVSLPHSAVSSDGLYE